jgi:simple sugar transport system ATP-binding protein
VLTPQAVEKLFETLRRLAANGCSILYISHKLDEIRALCHRATVLRSGHVTGTCDPRHESASSLARMMIGSDLPHPQHRAAQPSPTPVLELDALSLAADDPFGTSLHALRLAVHAGEIVGVAGVSGNGQRELLAALSGERRTSANAVRIDGAPIGELDANARRSRGLATIPEERLGRGAVPEMTLAENTLLTSARQGLVRRGLVDMRAAKARAARIIDAYRVRAPGPAALAGSLSGGNLQKFIVGREILQTPRVLVAAQPTWGVDVGAAALIRQALLDLRDAGVAILVISEELDELFEIADRIAVIAQGRLSEAQPIRSASAESIGMLMSGAFAAPGAHRHPPASPAGHVDG